MKPWLRFFLGAALALCGAAAAHAQSLSPTGISASPASVLPGDSVTYTIAVSNSTATQFGPGATATFSIVLTNTVSGSSFTVNTGAIAPTGGFIAAAAVDPTTGQVTPGAGTFTATATVPTQTTEAGTYRATATITAISVGGVVGSSFSVSSTALTITGKPDLQITALSYASGTSYTGGTIIPMTLTYRNNSSTNGVQNVPYVPGINGFPTFVRIQVVLSTNPTFGDADDFQLTINDISSGVFGSNQTVDNVGNSAVLADNSTHTYSWNQILPGNFSGSYYVLAKVDSLNALSQNDPAALTVNGNNVWIGNAINPTGTLINLLPTNFPTTYLASHGTGVSTTSSGYSDNPSISADGRYVAFASDGSNLVTGDTNSARDIFLFDSQTSLVRRLSVSQQGAQGNGASNNPAISAAGRYVAFASDANNLVIGDTNGFADIFVVDTLTGLINRVSGANSTGGQANNPSFRPAMSSNGRYIVFESTATNLTATATTSGVSHVYLYDRDVSNSGVFDTAGNTATKLIDSDVTTPATVAGNANAIQATISSDGTWVAFASKATNLVAPATTATRQHVYVRLLANVGTATSGIKLVSVVNTTAVEGNGDSQTPSLSSDGHYVAYASLATNLVAADANGVSDIFVYDNNQPVGVPIVRRMSVVTVTNAEGTDPSPAGFKLGSINPTISADGRYVAFASLDSNLTAGDTNGQSQAADANNALDIFVHDRDSTASGTFDTVAATTQMVSVNPFGYQTNGLLGIPSTAASNIYPVISANGRFVAFPSDAENTSGIAFGATNLLPLDSNGLRDVFLFDRRTNATVTPATPPIVTITSPGNASTALVNTTISLTASATTTTGVVASVQFFVNGTSLGTSTVFPYTQPWTPTAVGTYTLSALVTDSFGNIGVSPNVTVTIVAAPSIGITAPVTGTTITVSTAQVITAVAAASNPGATIASVQFFANNVSLGTDVTAPYSAPWTPVVPGTFTLTAISTDSIGTQATSAVVQVTVVPAGGGGGGGGGGLTSPTVAVSSPASGTIVPINVPQTVTATAAATSPGATVTSVQFFSNGVSIGTVTAVPFSLSWTPAAPGPFALTAVVTDSNGLQNASSAVTVNTLGAAPTVALSPAPPASVAVNIPVPLSATASAATGFIVTSVQFFAGGVSIGSATSFPYFVSWTPVATGVFDITAVATDNQGNKSAAATASVTVGSGTPPTVPLTSPINGAAYAIGNPIVVAATGGLGSGLFTGVQFFANGIAIGAASAPPFSVTFVPNAAGTYVFTVVATDSSGNRVTSTPVTVSVVAATAPTVAISSPASGAVLPVNVAQTVTAIAGSSTASLASVQFFVNGQTLGIVTAFPYSVPWIPTSPGTYVFTAVATDSQGTKSTSAPVSFQVTAGAPPDVSITAPATGSSYPVGNPVNLTATASSPNTGVTIASVQFLANGVVLATKTAFPYSFAWAPTATGTYTITAIATDSSGNLKISDPITVTIGRNAPPTISLTSPVAGSTFGLGNGVLLSATAADSDGTIASVQFFASGVLVNTATSAPYSFSWVPLTAGTYQITAAATDNTGNITATAQVPVTINAAAAATVAITNPVAGTTYLAGNSIPFSAQTTGGNGPIKQVQFFVNGLPVGTKAATPFVVPWLPTAPATYSLLAVATDSAGISSNSAPLSIVVNANAAPTVAITSPTSGTTVNSGAVVSLAATATDSDGTITSVAFLANGNVVGTATSAPYFFGWTPTAAGAYAVVAQATDNSGNVTNSSSITVNVAANLAPVVRLTAPTNGSVVRTGSPTTIVASATDTDGTIAGVQFFANGTSLGASVTTISPLGGYRAIWTPAAEGIYRLTAVAIDNSGAAVTSGAFTVMAVSTTGGGADTVYTGTYQQGFTETGNFALIAVRGRTATFIGYSTTAGLNRTYYYPGLTLDASGGFSQFDSAGRSVITGAASASGVSGTIDNGRLTFIGIDSAFFPSTAAVAPGYYSGSFTGRAASQLVAIIGYDASIFLYGSDGTFQAAGSGKVDSTGAFNLVATNGGRFTGKADPVTGFLTGTLSGTGGGGFTGATSSGVAFSDGFLTNLSTRGQVGTGANMLIAGFVISGSTAKQVLIRAVGPTLTTFGVTGTLANPLLQILSGNTLITQNDNWGGAPGTVTAASSVGAFPLPATSLDSVVVALLAPGAYTAQVSGVGGTSGVALVELYDLDNSAPFSSQKIMNLATRGVVAPGQGLLVAGFVVSGNTPKKVLIRGVGPSLAGVGITSGFLVDPLLRLVKNSDNSVVRENDNWEVGNDASLIADASTKVGAFALAFGGKDSVILINLPPGSYSAQVSGNNNGSGIALIEVYEVP